MFSEETRNGGMFQKVKNHMLRELEDMGERGVNALTERVP